MSRLDEFLKHWQSIPRAGLVPRLSDYLDRPHPALQPWTIIVDLAPTSMPVRLCGTGIGNFLKLEITGRDYLDAVRSEVRPFVLARDHQCAARPCGLRLDLLAPGSQGPSVKHVVLVLPVTRDGRGASLVRVMEVQNFRDRDENPMRALQHQSVSWIDLGHGVPTETPWAYPG